MSSGGDRVGDDRIIFIANFEGELLRFERRENLVPLHLWSINLLLSQRKHSSPECDIRVCAEDGVLLPTRETI